MVWCHHLHILHCQKVLELPPSFYYPKSMLRNKIKTDWTNISFISSIWISVRNALNWPCFFGSARRRGWRAAPYLRLPLVVPWQLPRMTNGGSCEPGVAVWSANRSSARAVLHQAARWPPSHQVIYPRFDTHLSYVVYLSRRLKQYKPTWTGNM